MRNCYEDPREAVEETGRDHVHAKQAIREMKVVKQQLMTYSQSWDERWEDRGGGIVMLRMGRVRGKGRAAVRETHGRGSR
jgi:hypothetical protein